MDSRTGEMGKGKKSASEAPGNSARGISVSPRSRRVDAGPEEGRMTRVSESMVGGLRGRKKSRGTKTGKRVEAEKKNSGVGRRGVRGKQTGAGLGWHVPCQSGTFGLRSCDSAALEARRLHGLQAPRLHNGRGGSRTLSRTLFRHCLLESMPSPPDMRAVTSH